MSKGNTRTHVLLTLGALFTISGATRVLPHPFAVAESNPAKDDSLSAPVPDTMQAAYPIQEQSRAEDQICFTDQTANALAEDQERFAARLESLDERELALQVREKELSQQAQELKILKQTLEERWAKMSASADEDLKHLAQMYGAMKSDQAAGIFNQMDPAFAAGFLRLMQSEQAGKILADMDKSKAYVVSVELASINVDIRSASAPGASVPQ